MVKIFSAKKYWWVVFYLFFLILFLFFLFNASEDLEKIEPPDVDWLSFDVAKAMRHLQEINRITEINGGRRAGTDGSLQAAAYIEEKFREAGIDDVERQQFKQGEKTLINIMACLPGQTDRQIIIAAHHDTAGAIPGIIDNASGVSVVLVLAELFSSKNVSKKMNHTLLLVSFDGEEQGALGSKHFVEQLSVEERETIDAMISVESVGWKDGDPVLHIFEYDSAWDSQRKQIAPGWLVRSMIESAHAAGERIHVGDKYISLFYQVTVRLAEMGFYSDDYPFVSHGIPGLFLSCFYLTNFYPEYHTGQDSLDQIGEEQLASAGRIVEASLYHLDRLDQRPQQRPDYIFLFHKELTGRELKALCFILFLLIVSSTLTSFWLGSSYSFSLWFVFFAIIFWYSVLADPVVFFYYFLPASLAIPFFTLRKRMLSSIFFILSVLIFIPLFTWFPYLFYTGFLQSITLPLWETTLFFFLLLMYLFAFLVSLRKLAPQKGS